jgi:hypothetical protein
MQVLTQQNKDGSAVTECYQRSLEFPRVKRRRIEVNFDGGDITSDGGVVLLREIDRRLGLTKALDRAIDDARVQGRCEHKQLNLLRQRIYGLASGYEDLNDHEFLRYDPALQTAVDADKALGSAPTLCRLEARASRETAVRIHEVLVEQFIASFDKPPRKLILDFDATDNPIHGDQVGKYFHRFYDHYCFLPLYVFCGHQLLVSYLRPASVGAAHNSGAILALLVKRLRQEWPRVQIVFRGDAGFCNPLILSWCDRHKVDYVVGIAQNSRLLAASEGTRGSAQALYELNGRKQQLFSEFRYAARSWSRERRVIVKAEHNAKGANPRFVVTSLQQRAEYIYRKAYCARGDMENRIKEQQLLFSGRTSCHQWWSNQFRLLLAGLAYTLVERMRHLALARTSFAKAQVDTIRLKLLKIGGVVLRNTRRVRLMLSSAYPYKAVFVEAATTLNTS